MRSVNRGPWPTSDDGLQVPISEYGHAKAPLIERIGEYCSYCERPGDLHVEHVVPKSICEELEKEWSNFLLGCGNCNSRKGNGNASREGYLWPDHDNTFAAFEYEPGGRVCVSEDLSQDEHRRASALFGLVGLGETGTPTDRRRHKRRQAWDKAVLVRDLLNGENSRVLAVEVALGTGFFSVWMVVFRDDCDMRQRLMDAFPGTRVE
ncbi:MAG: HNH endonuclease [Gammaproteobacteria bacterium]|nr:HNH endonuclease [Rhodobacter sp.]MCY4340653.1 HNH endonuclease [Gammaproteobacteria bacterium]